MDNVDNAFFKYTDIIGPDGIAITREETHYTVNYFYRTADHNIRLHRVDGPARFMKESSASLWYYHGMLHRYDGPAHYSEYCDFWYIKGIFVIGSDYLGWIEDHGMDINNLSENDKILIDMRWTMV